VAPLSDGEPEARELHGLEAFFARTVRHFPQMENGDRHLPRCRTVIMTLALTLGPLIRSWNFVLYNLVFNACVVALLTWVVMP